MRVTSHERSSDVHAPCPIARVSFFPAWTQPSASWRKPICSLLHFVVNNTANGTLRKAFSNSHLRTPSMPSKQASGDSPNYGEGGGGGSGTSGAAIVRGGGVAKRARKTGVSLSLDAAQSNGSSGIDFVGGDPNAAGNRNDGGGVVDTVGMAAAVDPAIAVLHKRARVGPRLIGREVR